MQKYLPTFVKGMLMGAADIVPGVSGGTIALLVGIYEKLLGSLAAIKIQKPFSTIDWVFFIPLGAGIVSSILLLSNVIHIALTSHTGPTFAFFAGLILFSGLLILRRIHTYTPSVWILLFLGAWFAYAFIGLNPISGIHTPIVTFFSGAVAIMAMLLPGVSGSFLLLFLGQYEHILGAVRQLDVVTLIIFITGCAVGILAFSRFLNWLLKAHPNPTMAFLIGLILGSMRLPLIEISAAGTSSATAVAFALLGAAIVVSIERLAKISELKQQKSAESHKTC